MSALTPAQQSARIAEHGKSLDYEQEALDSIRRSWGHSDKACMALALADGQVWATLHLARTTATAAPVLGADLAALRQQVQQARNDSYEQACDHSDMTGHEAQQERAFGRVEALDEVLGMLAEGERQEQLAADLGTHADLNDPAHGHDPFHPHRGPAMTGRIHWEQERVACMLGYAGTYRPWAFQIHRPGQGWAWTLITQVPGVCPGVAEDFDPEVLKAEAEKLLAEFVSSLGANFPPGTPPAGEGDQ